jgi:hypothetical protein
MVRFDLILGFIELALLIFCLVDVISIYDSRIKSLSKIAWVFIIILLPILGPILWLTLGRMRGGEDDTVNRISKSRAPKGPDDDAEFLRNASRHEDQEARIRQLEAELKALNDDTPEE